MVNHCQLLQAGEIQVIVGDASRDGVGGAQYCGLWSLTSRHRQFNAFGNSYAGLLPSDIRGKSPTLQVVDDKTCVLSRPADDVYPVDTRAEYSASAPYYVDHTLSIIDRQDVRRENCDFREVSWCCYMNCPSDPRLHFLSNDGWQRYISPSHGVAANIAPDYVGESGLEQWPLQGQWIPGDKNCRPFHWERAEMRFSQPFYYGRVGDMVMILIFDTPQWLRFFCSPNGGGPSLHDGETCPAWDFEWVIPKSDYRINKNYTFRTRLVYKQYISDEDVLMEVKKAQETLGFEAV